MDIRAVIMAGGVGTRFWPLSRQKKAKQFLPIISNKTMIEETVRRIYPWLSYDKIYTIAGNSHSNEIKKALPGLQTSNILVEPCGRNTAPSLILATASIYVQNPDAIVIALPADHLIRDNKRFLEKLISGTIAVNKGSFFLTFGIPPSYPATGYGYIHAPNDPNLKLEKSEFLQVQSFKEKPDYDLAKSFLESGEYYWNSGIFIWKASVFAEKLKQFSPEIYPFWPKIVQAIKTEDKTMLSQLFLEMPAISIDYALIEKAQGVLMSPGDFGWSDVGSWSALPDIWGIDKNGNALKGDCLSLESKNCLLFNPDKFTALIGLRDLIVVNTDDALLVCKKEMDQSVKDIVERLKKDKRFEHI